MKTIFIATDFSAASRSASLYGVELARAYKANVVLFNAYQVPLTLPDALVLMLPTEVKLTMGAHLEKEVECIDPSGNLSIETICEEAIEYSPVSAIIEKATEKKADVIIVGMKGHGKGMRKLFGTTAAGLMKKSNLPLLVIPEDAQYSIPKTIILASDIDEEMETNIHILYFLRQIAERFESRICVVRVAKRNMNDMYELRYESHRLNCLLANLDVKYEYPDDYDVTRGLNKLVKEKNADLLVMIPHKHDLLERIFIRSETKNMLFHTMVPLLILPEKAYETQKKGTGGSIQRKLVMDMD